MASDVLVKDAPSASEQLKSATPEERKQWRISGDLPPKKEPAVVKEPPKSETEVAESSPAAKVEVTETPAKAAETPAESVPAKSEHKAKGAEARIKDLLARVNQLESQIEAREKAAAATPKKSDAPPEPSKDDVEEKTGTRKYYDASGNFLEDKFRQDQRKWDRDEAARETREQLAKEATQRHQQEIAALERQEQQTLHELAMTRHPDLNEVVQLEKGKDGITRMMHPELKKIQSRGVLDFKIQESEVGWDICYYLCKNPGLVDKIQAQKTLLSFNREFRAVERAVESELAKSGSALPAKPAESSPAKTTIKVPPEPAASIGGKGTPPVDEESAAVAKGDFRAFAKTANEADWRKKKES